MDVGVAQIEVGCGAVCCIAGAVCQFNDPFDLEGKEGEIQWGKNGGVFQRAVALLGITNTLARRMFHPNEDNGPITAAIAVATLREFLATGELNWPEALGEHGNE